MKVMISGLMCLATLLMSTKFLSIDPEGIRSLLYAASSNKAITGYVGASVLFAVFLGMFAKDTLDLIASRIKTKKQIDLKP